MKKTFYSVEFSTFGSSSSSFKWFDSLAAAKAFSSQDYTGSVVTHRCSNPETIELYEALVAVSAGTATLQQENLACFGRSC